MPSDSYTKLLLHFNGANAGTSFPDSSLSNKIVTANGGVQISALQSKFGITSGLFNGSTGYLSLPDSADWNFGSGDFTIELWAYFSVLPTSGNVMTVYNQRVDGNNAIHFSLRNNTGTYELAFEVVDSSVTTVSAVKTITVSTGTWYHLAVTRNGNDYRLFQNGVQLGSTTTASGSLPDLASAINIGRWMGDGSYLNGYLDEYRVSKGIARWTAAFSPPDKPYDIATPDQSDTAIVVTPLANVQAVSVQKKWNGSVYCPGNDDGMMLNVGTDWDFKANSFTMDFWVRFADINRDHTIMSRYTDDSNYWALQHCRGTGFKFIWYTGGVGHLTTFSEGQVNCVIDTWYHVALVRNGSVFSLYNNGVLVARSTDTGAMPVLTGPVYMGSIPPDQYTKLLLHMDGDNNSTYFKDSEQTPKTVTVNGDAKISTTQSKFGGASAYFDGTGDYLAVSDSDDWNFGTGEWTVEFWARPALSQASTPICINHTTDVGSWGFAAVHLSLETDGSVSCHMSSNGSAWDIMSGATLAVAASVQANQWQHFALIRSANNILFAIDGVVKSTTAIGAVSLYSAATRGCLLGRQAGGNEYPGYLDELRISKGLARWTANFAPPGGPYQAPLYGYLDGVRVTRGRALWQAPFIVPDAQNNVVDSYTKLLIRPDNGFRDSSQNQRAITNTSVTMSTSVKKLGTQSMAFNGSSAYLSVPDSTDWDLGSGDFTVDFWFNLAAYPSLGATNTFVCRYEPSGNKRQWACVIQNDGAYKLGFTYSVNGSDVTTLSYTITPSLGVWYHAAFVRDGTIVRLFLNGVMGTGSIGTDTVYSAAVNVLVGAMTPSSPTNFLNGYLDEFRITKGLARWTANFVPEYKPYPVQTFPNRIDAETKLLVHGNQTDPYVKLLMHCDNYYDESGTGKALTFTNATISSAQSKFGGYSALFNGTSAYISSPDSVDWNFGSGDFTIDCWVRFNTLPTTWFACLAAQRYSSGSNNAWGLFFRTQTSNALYFEWTPDGSTTSQLLVAWTPATATWYHVAVVRNGNVLTIYINGVPFGSVSITGSIYDSSEVLQLGAGNNGGTYNFFLDGYMDEARISKGIARWVDNFTPPTAAYPMLICDSSPSNKTVYVVNHTKLDTSVVKLGNASLSFDGNDYLDISSSLSDFTFGSGAFTIDFWIYLNEAMGTDRRAMSFGGSSNAWSGTTGIEWHILIDTSARLTFQWCQGGSSFGTIRNTVSAATAWHHVAVTGDGTTIRLFFDGVQIDSLAGTISAITSPTSLSIGQGRAASSPWNGYIDEVRVTKGIARWTTASFTPPTKQYPEAKEPSLKLLAHMEQVIGAPTNFFLDSVNNKYMVPDSGVSLSATQKKFGTRSAYFATGTNKILVPHATDFNFSTNDFTIDFWVYPTSISSGSYPYTIFVLATAGSPGGFLIGYANNALGVYNYKTSTAWDSTLTLSLNTWSHVALVRNGSTLRLSVNGTQQTTTGWGSDFDVTDISFGYFLASSSGYIDEIRVNNGLSRWNANFTVPSAPYPDYQ